MTKNIFDETVKTLTNDTSVLTKKYHDFLNNGKAREAIDTLRLLKDTLSLIKEYDWHLEYSEYETDGHNEVAVWEQNHSGEVKNYKKWEIKGVNSMDDFWYKYFKSCILQNKSSLIDKFFSNKFRCTGKTTALSRLCNEYGGLFLYRRESSIQGVINKNKEFMFKNAIDRYFRGDPIPFERIIFLDEGHGLSNYDIDLIGKSNIVIGFSD